MANDLNEKVVVITGAAGAIGAATARLMSARGAIIVAVDRPGTSFDRLQSDLGKAAKLLTLEADVSDEQSVAHYTARTKDAFGRIDVFFNNAGIEGVFKPIPEYPLDVFKNVLAVNVVGIFLGMKHVIPIMVGAGRGNIINTSSIAGLQGSPGLAAYVASKHAVIGLTRTAALEWAPKGLRINCVNPGPIESRMMASIEQGAMPGEAVQAHAAFAQGVPARRYGTVDEVAALVAFLACDEAAYINGAIYPIDGGMTAG